VGGIRVLGDERLRLALRALEVVREGVECGGCLVIPVLQRREPIGDLARVLGELVEGIALVLFRVGDRGAQTRDGVVDGIGRRREPRGLGADRRGTAGDRRDARGESGRHQCSFQQPS